MSAEEYVEPVPLDDDLAAWLDMARREMDPGTPRHEAADLRAELETDVAHWKAALVSILQGIEREQAQRRARFAERKQDAWRRPAHVGRPQLQAAEHDYRDWLERSMGAKRAVVERLQHVKALVHLRWDQERAANAARAAANEARKRSERHAAIVAAGTDDDRVTLAIRLCGAVLRELALDCDIKITPRVVS